MCKPTKLIENKCFSLRAYTTVMILTYLNCTDAVNIVLSFDKAYLLHILERN